MVLPKNNIWRTWVFVGAPLTPNALNSGRAGFPEYHNVYIQPWAYATYKKTHEFPEGTIMFKELQLTLPAQNSDGSRSEPSGRGYFPGAFNGADVTVKDSKRYAATGGWGFFDFNHHEPKVPTTAVQPKEMCAFCHLQGAKKDEVWTQFYAILEQ
jgi:cytochrome P460